MSEEDEFGDRGQTYRITVHTVGEMDAEYTVWLQYLNEGTGEPDEVDVGDYDRYQDAVAWIESVDGKIADDNYLPEGHDARPPGG